MRFEIIIVVFATILGGSLSDEENLTRIKRRMYAMCPPKFLQIGAECYFVSDTADSWLEAHFRCKDKNSKLAEPEKMADRRLRTFLNAHDKVRSEIWIGGQYNDKTNIWQWGISGRNFTYQSFSQKDPRSSQDFKYYCAVFDPTLKYRWSARPCVDNHRYICQHKMPKVSENHRTKIYSRWNITYPNEMANEVELEVIESRGNGTRVHRRVKPVNSNDIFSYPVLNSRQNRRQPNVVKQRRRPFVTTSPSKNDVNHGYMSNSLDPLSPTQSPEQIQFEAEQRRRMQQRRRNRTSTPEPSYNNETVERKNNVDKTKAPRQKKEFDRVLEEKRRQERERKRKLREHRLKRKLLREKEKQMRLDKLKLDEEQRLREQREKEQQELETIRRQEIEQVEKERKEAEFEQRRLQQQLIENQVRQNEKRIAEERRAEETQENERKQKEEEEKRNQELEDRRRKQIEEERQRQHDERRENERKETEKRMNEERVANERRQEEEAENRRQVEFEQEQRKRDEFERRQREEEFDNNVLANNPAASEEATYRRHAHNPKLVDNPSVVASHDNSQDKKDEIKKQTRIEEERREAERLHKERLREEAELARLQEEQLKRAEIQRIREEEIQRRQAAIREQEEEEKRLQEDMKKREEEAQRQKELDKRLLEEKHLKEEEEKRIEAERREANRRHLELLKKKAEEGQQIEEKEIVEQEKNEKKRRLRERLAKLSPEERMAFLKLKQKKNRNHNNESNIPE